MSKRIFIDGNINSEICIIATDGQDSHENEQGAKHPEKLSNEQDGGEKE